MFARKARWPVIAGAITGLLLSACAPTTTTGGGSPTPGASPATTVLRMARNAEPFSPFVPWQIDDNPALFISVNVYVSPSADGVHFVARPASTLVPSFVVRRSVS